MACWAMVLSEESGWSTGGGGAGAGGGGVGGVGEGALLTDEGGELDRPAELTLLCSASGDSAVAWCKEPEELLGSWFVSPLLLTGRMPPFSAM